MPGGLRHSVQRAIEEPPLAWTTEISPAVYQVQSLFAHAVTDGDEAIGGTQQFIAGLQLAPFVSSDILRDPHRAMKRLPEMFVANMEQTKVY